MTKGPRRPRRSRQSPAAPMAKWVMRTRWVRGIHRLGCVVGYVGMTAMTTGCFAKAKSNGTSASASPAVAEPIRVPRNASRFEIDIVDDSTARFKIWEADWVRAGFSAHVVDPLQRDALVASVRITSVEHGMAIALVTSQVTRVRVGNVVMLTPPPTPLWKQQRFWFGAVFGGLIGGVLGAHHVF